MPARRPSAGRRAISIAAVIAMTIAGVGALGATSAQAATPRVAFVGAVPSWAKKANTVGTPSPNAIVEGEMFLPLQDQQGAEDFAAAVSDPSSSQYRHYLTPDQWIAQYSPKQADFASRMADITGTPSNPTGLTITGTPASRQYIVFRGTVKAVDAHFGTSLATYSVTGHDVIAPSIAPSLPTTEAAHVAGLVLDQGRLLTRPDSISQDQAAAAASISSPVAFQSLIQPHSVIVKTACSAYTGQVVVRIPTAYGRRTSDTANCGYTPKQLRSVYKTSSTSGVGQTVAIVDAYNSPTIVGDTNGYSSALGEPALTRGQYQDYSVPKSEFTDQAACGFASGWQGEQTLDVEAVHAIAPQANIVYVGASNCGGGTDLALSTILDEGLATIVSNSYGGVGEPTGAAASGYIAGEINLQLQAAGEGIGLYFASGDSGDERASLGYQSPDFPASSPWVTAVGGTSLGVSKTSARTYENGWGDTLDQITTSSSNRTPHYHEKLPGTLFAGGAGGGRSRTFARPAYQTGVVSGGVRLSPDVAALADPYTGFAVGYHPITNNSTLATGRWKTTVAGGTSLATPLMAGMMAAVQQQTGARIGFANPIIYAQVRARTGAIADVPAAAAPAIVAYSNTSSSYLITQGIDSGYRTSKTFDFVTGNGVLDMSKIAGFATPAAGAE